MPKLIIGPQRSGKTTHLLDWLWKFKAYDIALFVPDGARKVRIEKSVKGELNVFGPHWYRARGNKFDYSAIDDLWHFDNPKQIISEVSTATEKEVRCTMGDHIFDISRIEDVGKYHEEEESWKN